MSFSDELDKLLLQSSLKKAGLPSDMLQPTQAERMQGYSQAQQAAMQPIRQRENAPLEQDLRMLNYGAATGRTPTSFQTPVLAGLTSYTDWISRANTLAGRVNQASGVGWQRPEDYQRTWNDVVVEGRKLLDEEQTHRDYWKNNASQYDRQSYSTAMSGLDEVHDWLAGLENNVVQQGKYYGRFKSAEAMRDHEYKLSDEYLSNATGERLRNQLKAAEEALSISGGKAGPDKAAKEAKARYDEWERAHFMAEGSQKLGALDDETLALLDAYNGVNDSPYSVPKQAWDYLPQETKEQMERLGFSSAGSAALGQTDAGNKLRAKGYSQDEIASLAEYRQFQTDAERARRMAQQTAQATSQNTGTAIAYSVASVLLSPMKALGLVESLRGVLPRWLGGYVNPNAPTNVNSVWFDPTRQQQTIRGTVTQMIVGPENKNAFWGAVYNGVMSTADSALNMALGGGIAKGLGVTSEAALNSATANTVSWLMGSQVAADTVYEEIQHGRSNAGALGLGIVRGLIEHLTEKYSIENFLSEPKSVGRALAKSFVSEGSEEVASNWANRLVDFVLDNQDELKKRIARIKKSGVTDDAEALLLAMAEEDIESFVIGGLAGVAMSGVNMGYRTLTHADDPIVGAQLRAANALGELTETALSMDPDTRSYKLATEILNKENPTDEEIGALYRTIEREVDRDTGKRIKAADQAETVIQAALSLPAESEAHKLAEKVTRTGSRVTDKQVGQLYKAVTDEVDKANIRAYNEAVEGAKRVADAKPAEQSLDSLVNAYRGLGMKEKAASQKAALVQKVRQGVELTPAEVRALNFTNLEMQRVFTEATGIKIPEGVGRILSQPDGAAQLAADILEQSKAIAAGAQAKAESEVRAKNAAAVDEILAPYRGAREMLTAVDGAVRQMQVAQETVTAEELTPEAPISAAETQAVPADATINVEGKQLNYEQFRAFMGAAAQENGATMPDDATVRAMFDKAYREEHPTNAQGGVSNAGGEESNGTPVPDSELEGRPGERTGEQDSGVRAATGETAAEPAGGEAVRVDGTQANQGAETRNDAQGRSSAGGLSQAQREKVKALNPKTRDRNLGGKQGVVKMLTPASQRKALQAFPALRAVNRKVVDLGGKMSLVMGGIRTGMLNARGRMILAEGMTDTNSKEIVIQLDSNDWTVEQNAGHEYSHLRYALDPVYRAAVDKLVDFWHTSAPEVDDFLRERYDSTDGDYAHLGDFEQNYRAYYEEFVGDLAGNLNRCGMDEDLFRDNQSAYQDMVNAVDAQIEAAREKAEGVNRSGEEETARAVNGGNPGRGVLRDGGLPGRAGIRTPEQAGRLGEAAGGAEAESAGAAESRDNTGDAGQNDRVDGRTPGEVDSGEKRFSMPRSYDKTDYTDAELDALVKQQNQLVASLGLKTQRTRSKGGLTMNEITDAADKARLFDAFPELRTVKNQAKKYGVISHFAVGSLRCNNNEVGGTFNSLTNELTVRVDHPSVPNGTVAWHEFSHLRYYLDEDYRAAVDRLIFNMRMEQPNLEVLIRKIYDSVVGPYSYLGDFDRNYQRYFGEFVADMAGHSFRWTNDWRAPAATALARERRNYIHDLLNDSKYPWDTVSAPKETGPLPTLLTNEVKWARDRLLRASAEYAKTLPQTGWQRDLLEQAFRKDLLMQLFNRATSASQTVAPKIQRTAGISDADWASLRRLAKEWESMLSLSQMYKLGQRNQDETTRNKYAASLFHSLLNSHWAEEKGPKFSVGKQQGLDNSVETAYNKNVEQYTSDEAKRRWAADPKYANLAHKEMAYIVEASRNGVHIPLETLRADPLIAEAEAKVRALGNRLSADDNPISKVKRGALVFRLLDEQHGSYTGRDANGEHTFSGPVATDKLAFLVLGRPGGGKSSVFANRLSRDYLARVLDSDEIKPRLNGYDDGIGAGYVRTESSAITEEALTLMEERGENVVIPLVGSRSTLQFADDLRKRGYTVYAYLNDVAPESGYMRTMARYAEESRYIGLDYQESIGDTPAEIYRELVNSGRATAGEWRNNDVRLGESPRLVERSGTPRAAYARRNREGSQWSPLGVYSGDSQEGRGTEKGRKADGQPVSGRPDDGQPLGQLVKPGRKFSTSKQSNTALSDYQNTLAAAVSFMKGAGFDIYGYWQDQLDAGMDDPSVGVDWLMDDIYDGVYHPNLTPEQKNQFFDYQQQLADLAEAAQAEAAMTNPDDDLDALVASVQNNINQQYPDTQQYQNKLKDLVTLIQKAGAASKLFIDVDELQHKGPDSKMSVVINYAIQTAKNSKSLNQTEKDALTTGLSELQAMESQYQAANPKNIKYHTPEQLDAAFDEEEYQDTVLALLKLVHKAGPDAFGYLPSSLLSNLTPGAIGVSPAGQWSNGLEPALDAAIDSGVLSKEEKAQLYDGFSQLENLEMAWLVNAANGSGAASGFSDYEVKYQKALQTAVDLFQEAGVVVPSDITYHINESVPGDAYSDELYNIFSDEAIWLHDHLSADDYQALEDALVEMDGLEEGYAPPAHTDADAPYDPYDPYSTANNTPVDPNAGVLNPVRPLTDTNTPEFKNWFHDNTGELTGPNGDALFFLSGSKRAGHVRSKMDPKTKKSPGEWYTRLASVAVRYAEGASRNDFTLQDVASGYRNHPREMPIFAAKDWNEAMSFVHDYYETSSPQTGEVMGLMLEPMKNGQYVPLGDANSIQLRTNYIDPAEFKKLVAPLDINDYRDKKKALSLPFTTDWHSLAEWPNTPRGLEQFNREINDLAEAAGAGPRGYEAAYLSMQNGIVVDANGADFVGVPKTRLPETLREPSPQEKAYYNAHGYNRSGGDAVHIDDLAARAQAAGYDGLIVKNVFDDGGLQNQYVVFNSNQVKSIYNAGTWDPGEDNRKFSASKNQQSERDEIIKAFDAEHGEGSAQRIIDILAQQMQRYGQMPQAADAAREVRLPQRTRDADRVSRTPLTVAGSEATPGKRILTIEDAVASGKMSYVPITNKISANKAKRQLQINGWNESLRKWQNAVQRGQTSADLVAMGATLLNNAGNSNASAEDYLNLLSDYSRLLRNSGQAVQAANILKRMTPEGRLYEVQRTVDQLNEKLREQEGWDPTSGEFEGIKIDPALVEQYRKAKTDEERDAILDLMAQNVADQMRSTGKDLFTAWRYLNMLGNFRTQVRNLAGNLGFQPVRMIKDSIVGLTEAALQKAGVNVDRTSSATWDMETFKAAADVYQEYRDTILSGGKYQDDIGRDFAGRVEDARRIFDHTKYKTFNKTAGKALEAYRQATNWAMDQGDAVFCEFTFRDSLARFMAANHTTWPKASDALRTRAVNKAIRDAAEATYRDNNELSVWISRLARGEGTPKIIKAIGEGLLPFRKTPTNILKRAYEYSPLSIIGNTITDIKAARAQQNKGKASNADITANDIIEQWAKTFTGTGLAALGYALAAMGKLIGKAPDDDKEKALFEQQGKQAYALAAGGHTYTLDWLAPEAIPLFLGANIAQAAMENGLTLKEGLSAILQIGDPILEMSMLQGVNDALENASSYGEDSALVSFIANAAWSYATQGLTNTLVGQLERGLQGNQRMQTYVDKNDWVPDTLQRTIGKTSAKVPGWDYNQIPYIDAWGDPQENADSETWNVITQLFSPAYVTRERQSATLDEISRLYDETGDSGIILDRAPKYFRLDNATVHLTADEYVTYAMTRGGTAKAIVADLVESPKYQALSDSQRNEVIKIAYDYANQMGKAAVSAFTPEKWVLSGEEAVQQGMSLSDYMLFRASLREHNEGSSSISNAEREAAIRAVPGLSNAERDYLWVSSGGNPNSTPVWRAA